jgi:CRP/FNR family transcriptional regulator
MSLVQEIAFRPVDSRLASFLLERFATDGVIEATHDEIASELGTAREVVSRAMRRLARAGAIDSIRGRVALRDAALLRQII